MLQLLPVYLIPQVLIQPRNRAVSVSACMHACAHECVPVSHSCPPEASTACLPISQLRRSTSPRVLALVTAMLPPILICCVALWALLRAAMQPSFGLEAPPSPRSDGGGFEEGAPEFGMNVMLSVVLAGNTSHLGSVASSRRLATSASSRTLSPNVTAQPSHISVFASAVLPTLAGIPILHEAWVWKADPKGKNWKKRCVVAF
jgi:hypothetical protein